MKNVLIVVYYFPPMGGSGVQRPLKFIKYLPQFGWNPIVLCPQPGIYHTFDYSLTRELQELKVDIHRVEANTLFHKAAGTKPQKQITVSDKKARLLRKLSRLLFYPDNKRGWISPAVKEGVKILKQQKIDAIFSTAPPFSNHIIGKELKKISGLPLVLDYRDSWLHNHFFTDLFQWQKKIMFRMEEDALQAADVCITLDEYMMEGIIQEHPKVRFKPEIISHGYDSEDFEQTEEPSLQYQKGKLNVLYSGLFYESNQPDVLLHSVAELCKTLPEAKEKLALHFQGGLDERISKLIHELELGSMVYNYGYVPHRQAVANLKAADVLWMISNFDKQFKQVKSGKLFEYIGSKKPILGLVHSGAASKLLNQYKAGFTASPNSIHEVTSVLRTVLALWENKQLPIPDEEFVRRFDRKVLTQKLAQILTVISS